jgi:hemerythrin-like metal-binding protein
MDLLIWSHSYSIGNAEVDTQHQKLIDLINKLHSSTEGGATGDADIVLQELIDYTVYHFQSEEALQKSSGYPDYQAHKKRHEELVTQVSEKVAMYKSGDEAIMEKLMLFLVDWLKDHILGEDKKLGKYLSTQGATEEEDDL